MKNRKNQKKKVGKGFTLVELAVTLTVVIILMSISVPIYKSNVKNYKKAEGYALLASIRSAQERYYSEYGYFLTSDCGSGGNRNSNDTYTCNEEVLGINARTNKYFTWFIINRSDNPRTPNCGFWARDRKSFFFWAQVYGIEGSMNLEYNLTAGTTIY